MKEILFIGNIQFGESPTGGGAQAKNQIFLGFLQSKFENVTFFDTWKKNKIKSLLLILFKIIVSPNKKIILSLTFHGVYILSKIVSRLPIKRNIDYWVIGGDIAHYIKNNRLDATSYFTCFNTIVVEANYIARELSELGITNVKVVPNFKNIPDIKIKTNQNSKIRFVFLSRLIEEKGVGLIIDAASKISNQEFEVDFYGSVSNKFSKEYFEKLNKNNIKYKGFLDLESNLGYEILASYDVLLFPTYFEGEGFPGVLIDAFICGLPVITTNFHANSEIVSDGKNGIIIPPKNIEALKKAMLGFIDGTFNLKEMKQEALNKVKLYSVDNVLKEDFFR